MLFLLTTSISNNNARPRHFNTQSHTLKKKSFKSWKKNQIKDIIINTSNDEFKCGIKLIEWGTFSIFIFKPKQKNYIQTNENNFNFVTKTNRFDFSSIGAVKQHDQYSQNLSILTVLIVARQIYKPFFM